MSANTKPSSTPYPKNLPTIVLATGNANKVRELQILMPDWKVIPMRELGFEGDIQETGSTFAENAMIKANAVHNYIREALPDRNYIVVAEDSGLCVEALGGRPGVFTARYGGEDCTEAEQRAKLLEEMQGVVDRHAYFECRLACCLPNGTAFIAKGRTVGVITESERGENGFAFDKIFESTELGKTFGETTQAEKDSVSHRARATIQLRTNLIKLGESHL